MDAFINTTQEIDLAIQNLAMGKIIAYPTESVFGLGCDPFNADAVASLLELKQRPLGKGFILVGSHFEQLEHLTLPISPPALARVHSTWPGPATWIFPSSPEAPEWITGNNNSIALRVSAHPIIQQICQHYRRPIISTSANIGGQLPARSLSTLEMTFGKEIASIVHGELGGRIKPTSIRDAITGEVYRS